jgi:antitoxin ParD1/3/4
MNINLTTALEAFVKQKVASGLYNNASEVIREALRHEVQREDFAVLQTEVAKGFTQIAAGQVVTFDMAKAKRRALQNSKRGRTVNPLVTP